MRCEQPCKGCPWRAANQTPSAVAKSPVDGSGKHWFDPENLAKHWRGVAEQGVLLPCHETDPNAIFYGGKPVARSVRPRVCVGISMLALREVTAYMQAGQNYARYASGRPSLAFLPIALAAWASRLFFAGSTFRIEGRDLRMPKVERVSADVAVPYHRSLRS